MAPGTEIAFRLKQLSRIPNVSVCSLLPLFYLTPLRLLTSLTERGRATERPYLLSVGSSQVLSDGSWEGGDVGPQGEAGGEEE